MPSAFQYRMAARHVLSGGIIAYPTDTIYGLGCDPYNEASVRRIFEIKQRSANKNFILLASSLPQVKDLIKINPEEQQRVLTTTEPTSWIIQASSRAPAWLLDNNGNITVRISEHINVTRLCEEMNQAIVSTSANISGKPPAMNAMQLHRSFSDKLDMVLINDSKTHSKPSRVIRLCDNHIFR